MARKGAFWCVDGPPASAQGLVLEYRAAVFAFPARPWDIGMGGALACAIACAM